MSKDSGTGQKRMGERINKGMDKCDAPSHGKQCGRLKEVSKGNKKWTSREKEIRPFSEDISTHIPDD